MANPLMIPDKLIKVACMWLGNYWMWFGNYCMWFGNYEESEVVIFSWGSTNEV